MASRAAGWRAGPWYQPTNPQSPRGRAHVLAPSLSRPTPTVCLRKLLLNNPAVEVKAIDNHSWVNHLDTTEKLPAALKEQAKRCDGPTTCSLDG